MIRIELASPCLDEQARNMIAQGFGVCRYWELLEHLVKVARRDNLEIEFVRLENGKEVTFDLECMEAALEGDWEVRPLDSPLEE